MVKKLQFYEKNCYKLLKTPFLIIEGEILGRKGEVLCGLRSVLPSGLS